MTAEPTMHTNATDADDNRMRSTRRPLIAAGTTLGIGLGGFVDGILFHQILQLHSMLSAKYPTTGDLPAKTLATHLEVNMFWDGLFHALTWTMVVAGLAMLWTAVRDRRVPLSTRTLVGSILLGFGLFNFVEGIIDHHLLHLHHVVETPNHLVYDPMFLASGLMLIGVGGWLIKSDGLDEAVWPRRLKSSVA